MSHPYPVMHKGLCYFSTKKHHKKARFKKAFAREMARVRKILTESEKMKKAAFAAVEFALFSSCV